MLTDRFPILSFVPEAARAELNLDGEQVAVSLTMTYVSEGQLRLRSTPVIDQRVIAGRLSGKSFPGLLPFVDYSATVDERGGGDHEDERQDRQQRGADRIHAP